MDTPVSWARHAAGLPPDSTRVRFWTLSLDLPPETLEHLTQCLSAAEKDRAMGFHLPIHRNRYLAGRGQLRTILGRCLEADPRALEFALGSWGKPELGGRLAASGLRFNLSHCEDTAVLGVTLGVRIGVDVERVRRLDDAENLVARFFSPREARAFSGLDSAARPAAFFNLWTRKEAWLKATGQGIGKYLNRVEVSFMPGEAPQLEALPREFGEPKNWSLHSLEPRPGYVAAIAVDAPSTILDLS